MPAHSCNHKLRNGPLAWIRKLGGDPSRLAYIPLGKCFESIVVSVREIIMKEISSCSNAGEHTPLSALEASRVESFEYVVTPKVSLI